MPRPRRDSAQLVITCEHASNRIPDRYGNLGLSRQALDSHIAWDRGSQPLARHSARHFRCAYHEARYSRVLIDLNRSPQHRDLIPKISFGVRVPGNAALTAAERDARIRRYYQPYRAAVQHDIERALRSAICLHLSFHTFTSKLAGVTRRADVGVLYDPSRSIERDVASCLVAAFRLAGFRTRRNYPYRGTGDGLTTYGRRTYPADRYLGIELEFNQRLLDRPADIKRMQTKVVQCIERCLSRN